MKTKLSKQECKVCSGDTPPLKGGELEKLKGQLDDGWKVVKEHHLEREFKFKDFRSALDFTNRVGALAEEQGHHPDIYLTWGVVRLQMWTHKIDGLTENDFIFAAKVDGLKTDG